MDATVHTTRGTTPLSGTPDRVGTGSFGPIHSPGVPGIAVAPMSPHRDRPNELG